MLSVPKSQTTSKNIDKMIFFLWFVGVDPIAHLFCDQLNIPINVLWTSKSTNSAQWCSVLNFFGNLGCLVSKAGDTKLYKFLVKNPHTDFMTMYFVTFWQLSSQVAWLEETTLRPHYEPQLGPQLGPH